MIEIRTLYVVAHPEATHHVERVVGGQFDSELTDSGKRQASAIADRLAELVPGDVEVELFTSDLRRKVQTAEARWLSNPFHRLQPAKRRKTAGRPAWPPSPCTVRNISLTE